jgi:AraC-like DNA-binding protein
MDNISVCRAAYLIPFIEVLRDIGAPVERELELGKLPAQVEEAPGDFVSNYLALDFLARNERRESINDLGWLWAQRFSSSVFSTELTDALRSLPTVKTRLEGLARLIKLEDTDTRVGIINSEGRAEIYCDGSAPEGLNGEAISEWTQVMVLIEAVRSITGKTWTPDEIRFKSDFNVCRAARAANPNTRFIRRSSHTSIIVPSSVLAASKQTYGAAPTLSSDVVPADDDPTVHLKRLLRPYLRAAAPKIDVFADIAGTSQRTLQRKLKQYGISYSQILETTRFEMATEMLADPNAKLMDVAMTLGYENQSNFGRSFRRIAGISPGKYRRNLQSQGHAT